MTDTQIVLLTICCAAFAIFSVTEKLFRRRILTAAPEAKAKAAAGRVAFSIVAAAFAAAAFCLLIIAGVKTGVIAAAITAMLLFALI